MASYREYLSRHSAGEAVRRKRLEAQIGIDTYDADLAAHAKAARDGNYADAAAFALVRQKNADMIERTKALQEYAKRYGGNAEGADQNLAFLMAEGSTLDSYGDFAAYQEHRRYEEKLHNYDFDAAQVELDGLQKSLADLENGSDIAFASSKEHKTERKALEDQIAALQAEMVKARGYSSEGLSKNADFAEKSVAVSTNNAGFSLWEHPEADTVDWGHEYINGFWDAKDTYTTFMDEDPFEVYDAMTDVERARYNYFYNTKGKDVARQYLDSLHDTLHQSVMQGKAEYAAEHPVLATLGSIGMSFLGAVAEPGSAIAGESNYMAELSDTMRAGVAENIKNDIGAFFYNTGVSALQSLGAGLLLGPFGGATLGLSAMASTRNDLLRRGADETRALVGGLAAGVFEGLFETLSLGNLKALKEVPVGNFKDLVLNIAKSMGVNASEELATETANVLYDTLANGDFSNAAQMISAYMAQGMSEAEAKREVTKQLALQIGEAAASGAVMGAGFGALGSGASAAQTAMNTARVGAAVKRGAMPLGSLTELTKTGERLGVRGYARAAKKGERISNRAAGKLYRRVAEAIGTKQEGTVKTAIVKRLQALDASADKGLSDVVFKRYMKRTLSSKEAAALSKSSAAKQTLRELEGEGNAKWANDLQADLFSKTLKDVSELSEREIKAVVEAAREIPQSSNGKVTVLGNGASLGERPKIAAIGAAGAMLAAENGDTLALDEVAMPADLAMLYSFAELFRNAKAANDFVAKWDGQRDVEEYFKAYQLLHFYGRVREGYSEGEALERARKLGIDDATALTAFKNGYESLLAERREAGQRMSALIEKYRKGGAARPEGNFDDSAIKDIDLKRFAKENLGGEDIQALVSFARIFSKAFGINVRVIADKSEGHKNGSFSAVTNTITLNIYAGAVKGGELIRSAFPNVLSHETVHWMKHNAPEAYAALEDAVFAALKNASDYDFEAAVLREYAKYQKNGQHIEDSAAREEIVARACEDLLGRSEMIKQFLDDFAEQNKEAANGFVAAVKRILAKIKSFFEEVLSAYHSRVAEAEIVRRCGTDVVSALQQQFDKAFEAALEGNAARNALGEFEQGGVRFSRTANDNTEGDSIKEQLKRHAEALQEMEPVSDIKYTVINKGKARKDASEIFKEAGYKVDRQGFGVIEIGEKQLAESSNYLNTPAEFAAWMSIPKVLKRGVVISGHDNHKQRGFSTITIAAPVLVNGKRGNVAVVVQQTGKNKYHVHRILMPDGSKFVYENIQQNAEPTGDSIVREDSHKGLSISSASNSSISQNSEKSTPEIKKDNGERYSFVGENARTADHMRLASAKERIAAGEDSETVRRETGWFQGLDGKWRFEIDDSEITIARDGISPNYVEYHYLSQKKALGHTSEAEDRRLQRLTRYFSGIPYASLAHYVKHDKLFAAYPELLRCRCVFRPIEGGGAAYNMFTNQITIDSGISEEELKPFLIHEMQHAVQIIEDFAIGSTPTYWESELYGKREYENKFYKHMQLLSSMLQWFSRESAANLVEFYKLAFETRPGDRPVARENLSPGERARLKELYEQLYHNPEDVFGLFKSYIDIWIEVSEMDRQYGKNKPVDLYLQTAGEIEAADASKRAHMTEEQRKNTRPDVDRSDVVFADKNADFFKHQEENTRKKTHPDLVDDILLPVFSDHFPEIVGEVFNEEYDALYSDPEDDIDNRTFSYSELVAKGKIKGVIVNSLQQAPLTSDGKIDTEKILSIVRSKCNERKKEGATTAYYVDAKDIGEKVEIIRDGILHRFAKAKKNVGPRTWNTLLMNARVALELPRILSEAVEVNRSIRGNNPDVPYTHVLMGTAALEDHNGSLEYVAVRFMVQERLNQPPYLSEMEIVGRLTSTNAKKIDRPTGQGITPLTSGAAYAYSVADFLQDVKGVFDDTFSLDVYNHLGVQRKASDFSSHLLYSDPEDDVKSDREVLAEMVLAEVKDDKEYTELQKYQAKIKSLDKKNREVVRLSREIDELRFKKGKRGPEYYEQMEALVKARDKLDGEIRRADRALLALSQPLQDLVIREKKRTKELWRAKGAQAMAEYREKNLQRAYVEQIEKKAKSLRKLLLENSEKHHIPDVFKQPVAAFLSLLDFSSERALRGGEQTQRDKELHAAFVEVVEILKSITDEDGGEYFSCLDLPLDAVEELEELAKDVAQMAIEGREGGTMVLRRMSSAQLKTLNSTLYAMGRAVRQANELFATERYRHVSDLANTSIAFWEQFAPRGEENALKTFLNWENLTPYYAFERLGPGGEALFRGFMRGQSKFAFLSDAITRFTDQLYTDKEVREWSREVHTFDGSKGKVYITTAQIMSLYELWKDQDARKHILGGGGRILDIDFGAKKKYTNDPGGTALGELVVDAMFAKLTPRQKQVADSLQKFMAEECAAWGNEISYKRHGIRLFGLDYYFPIESDKNTLEANVEQRAKENGLFTLLHKSFTKKRVFKANNRIVIRSVFDVFAAHTTDMAKYNAFALPLLDMQKFINFKENVTKEQTAREAYENAEVNSDVMHLIARVKKGEHKDGDGVDLGTVTEDVAKKIKKVTGQDFTGYKIAIEARQVEHILKRHGENGSADHSMARDEDIAKMLFAISSPDNISDGGNTNAYLYMVDGKNRLAKTVLCERVLGEKSYYVVQTAVDTKKKTLHIVSAFIGESGYKKGAPQFTSAQGLGATSKTVIAGTPSNSIPQPSDIVKMGNATNGAEIDTSFDTKTVRGSMEKAFGKAAYRYIEQFLKDLNGEIGGRSAGEGMLQKGVTAYKIAAVGANLRVAFLQPTAYVRVLNVMEPKYFFGGLGVAGHLRACVEKMQKHSGIALWKSLGYRDANIAAPLQTKIKHDESWRDKVAEKSMILAELGDKATWGMIWYACELETRDKHKGLQVGSDAYYAQVAERFEEIIYKTQVVDSVFTKSQVMRSRSFFLSLISSFMSEPTLSYSVLASKAFALTDAKRRGERLTRDKMKPFLRAVGVFAVSATIQAMVESVIDAARSADGDDDENYGERWLDEFIANALQELIPFNLVPIIKDVWSIAFSLFRGDFYMSASRMDMEVYSRIARAVKAIGKMVEDGELTYSGIYKILTAISSFTGLPISNLVRDVLAIWNALVGSIDSSLIIN